MERHITSATVSADQPLSSKGLGWSGIEVEQLRFGAGENVIPALATHLIGIHTGAPMRMIQVRDGQQQETILKPGDFVLIPAGMENYCSHDVDAEGLYINLEPIHLQQVAESAGLDGDRVGLVTQFGAADGMIQHLAHSFAQELHQPGVGGRLFTESLTNTLIVHLIRQYSVQREGRLPSGGSLTRQHLQRVQDFIQDQLSADLSLESLAAQVHLTPFHFSRVFKQATGLSPHQYVIHQRVEAAKRLLNQPQLSLADIAAEVGFADQSHLTRHFKRITGLTPSQLR
jgi:AraC family transcriptional regulator